MTHPETGSSGNGSAMGASFGDIVRRRREAKGLTLEDLQQAIGGTPGPGFLARLEEGVVGPASGLVLKLANVLDLPADLMLNASGFTTETQRLTALMALGDDSPAAGGA